MVKVFFEDNFRKTFSKIKIPIAASGGVFSLVGIFNVTHTLAELISATQPSQAMGYLGTSSWYQKIFVTNKR